MRILLIAPQPFYIERGTPIAVRHLAEALSDMGHTIDLLTSHLGTDVAIPNCTIHRARGVGHVKALPIGFSAAKLMVDGAIFIAMRRLLKQHAYDVIHAVEEAVFLALPFIKERGPKLVYDMDSVLSDQMIEKFTRLSFAGRIMESLERKAVRKASLVLPVCQAIADRIGDWTDGNVHVLPDIAPEALGEERNAPSIRTDGGRPLALYVGNLDHYQGIDLLLDSLSRLAVEARPDTVIIGGSDEAIAHYRQRAGDLGMEGDVRFLGPRPLQDLMHYLAQADILYSPRTKGINTPMKVYAYMASGVPIVATSIKSHTQVLDNSCSFLADPDPDSFADALLAALLNVEKRREKGARAAAIARDQYGIARFRERLSVAYRQLENAGDESRETSPR